MYNFRVHTSRKLNLNDMETFNLQINIGGKNTAVKSVKQSLLFTGNERGKLIALRDIFRLGLKPPVLVFVQSKERAKELFAELIYDGMNVDAIHADRTPLQRENAVKCFRSGLMAVGVMFVKKLWYIGWRNFMVSMQSKLSSSRRVNPPDDNDISQILYFFNNLPSNHVYQMTYKYHYLSKMRACIVKVLCALVSYQF